MRKEGSVRCVKQNHVPWEGRRTGFLGWLLCVNKFRWWSCLHCPCSFHSFLQFVKVPINVKGRGGGRSRYWRGVSWIPKKIEWFQISGFSVSFNPKKGSRTERLSKGTFPFRSFCPDSSSLLKKSGERRGGWNRKSFWRLARILLKGKGYFKLEDGGRRKEDALRRSRAGSFYLLSFPWWVSGSVKVVGMVGGLRFSSISMTSLLSSPEVVRTSSKQRRRRGAAAEAWDYKLGECWFIPSMTVRLMITMLHCSNWSIPSNFPTFLEEPVLSLSRRERKCKKSQTMETFQPKS